MSEALSGLVQQTIQHTLENQSVKQQTNTSQNKPSFESYLQQDQNIKDPGQPATSGVQMQDKLNQMQNELTQKIQQTNNHKINPNEIPKELLDNKSRLGLLKEAYSKMGNTNATGGFEGRLMQTESEYKEVEALMKSDKNLSPGELLALQARLYQVSQHIEVMSKVVDQMAGGIKTVLNTNI